MPVADPGEGPGGPARPLVLDQSKARRAEKNLLENDPPPPPLPCQLSEGLDPPLKAVSMSGVSGFDSCERKAESSKKHILPHANPLLSTPGGLFIPSPFEERRGGGELNRDGGFA